MTATSSREGSKLYVNFGVSSEVGVVVRGIGIPPDVCRSRFRIIRKRKFVYLPDACCPGLFCDGFRPSSSLRPAAGLMSATLWEVSACFPC